MALVRHERYTTWWPNQFPWSVFSFRLWQVTFSTSRFPSVHRTWPLRQYRTSAYIFFQVWHAVEMWVIRFMLRNSIIYKLGACSTSRSFPCLLWYTTHGASWPKSWRSFHGPGSQSGWTHPTEAIQPVLFFPRRCKENNPPDFISILGWPITYMIYSAIGWQVIGPCQS